MHWSIISIPRDNTFCQFCSYNVIENEAHCVLECLFYNSIRNRFPSQFSLSKVALDGESFFQLDHDLVFISISPLRYSREFMLLTPSWWTPSPISTLASQTIQSLSFHFTSLHWELLLWSVTTSAVFVQALCLCCKLSDQLFFIQLLGCLQSVY